MYRSEPLVSELHSIEIEIYTVKLKRCETPATDQIPAKLIQAGGNTFVMF